MKIVQEQNNLMLIAEEDFLFQHAESIQAQLLQGVQGAENGTIVLDLTHTHTMDSMGVKLVIGLLKTCQKKKLPLQVTVSSPMIVSLLKLCKLTELLEIREGLPNG